MCAIRQLTSRPHHYLPGKATRLPAPIDMFQHLVLPTFKIQSIELKFVDVISAVPILYTVSYISDIIFVTGNIGGGIY